MGMDDLLLMFKALSDKNRLRIYSALMRYDELCACQIVELLQLAGATVSRHLGQMVRAGLITSRKDGRFVYYGLTPPDNPDFQNVRAFIEARLTASPDILADREALDRIIALNREDLCRTQRGEACCPLT
jgi:ArsR family transcriptional regulator